MSLKLAVVLVVAITGQSLAWPTVEGVQPAENESFLRSSEDAISAFLGKSALSSVTDGIRNCYRVTAEIFGNWRKQLNLYVQEKTAKLPLLANVAKCFLQQDVNNVQNCGSNAFVQYRDNVVYIGYQRRSLEERLSQLVNILPKCYTTNLDNPPRYKVSKHVYY